MSDLQNCGDSLIKLAKKVSAGVPWKWQVLIEILRWLVIVTPIYLSVWRYATLRGYTVFVEGAPLYGQFWGMVTLFVLLGTLLLYIPVKLLTLRYQIKHISDDGPRLWRPSVLVYVVLGALPCMTIILLAVKTSDELGAVSQTVCKTAADCVSPTAPAEDAATLDTVSFFLLQTAVMGLVLTEWFADVHSELLSPPLITAMANDFFFAYDAITFLSLPANSSAVFQSNWCHVCFFFALLSMLKYVPSPTLDEEDERYLAHNAGSVVVSLLCCEIPFVFVRVSTLVIREGSSLGDLVYPAKNLVAIGFGCAQLYMLWANSKERQPSEDAAQEILACRRTRSSTKPRYPLRRTLRYYYD